MIFKLTPTQSRTLAVALLVMLIGGVYLGSVRPYLEAYGDYQSRIGKAETQLARYRALIGQQDGLRKQFESLKNRPEFTEYFLKQPTPALAYAALQNLVKRAVNESGGKLVSAQTFTSESLHKGLVPVTVKVNMKGTLETVYSLFHSLEARWPLLFLDKVAIRKAGTRAARYRKTVAPQLNIQFNLTGYIRLEKVKGA